MSGRLFNRTKREAAARSVGIAIAPGQVTIAAFDGECDGLPSVSAWNTQSFESYAELQSALHSFVDQNGLAGQSCRCVLPRTDYSLRLVERPANIPEEELVDATRWTLRDLIEFDVEEAEIAIFSVPESDSRARTPRMFVAAARREEVTDLAHTIKSAGLSLIGFEIAETAMLCLEQRLPKAVAGGAMLTIEDKSSLLALSKDAHLYLARPVHAEAESVEEAARAALDGGDNQHEVMSLLDGLLLDVQRSLDYYESEYGQAPASRLTLLPSRVDMLSLVPTLSEAFRPMQIDALEIERIVSFEDPPPGSAVPDLTFAIAAGLADDAPVGNALVPMAFRSNSEGFDLTSGIRLIAAIAMVLAAYFVFASYQLTQSRARIAVLDAAHLSLSDQIDAAKTLAANRSSSFDGATELEARLAERDGRLAMLRDIGSRDTANTPRFSSLLSALTRQDLSSIWLERIAIAEGGADIALEGRTTRTEDVPKFLRRLGTEASFAKRRFGVFEMEQTDPAVPGTAFRVSTRPMTELFGGSPP